MRWALTMIFEEAAWRKISVSRTVGTAEEPIMSASTAPGPTEGSWSTSPTSKQGAVIRHRPQQLVHQGRIDHRDLVDHHQLAIERLVLVVFEAHRSGVELQQAVDRLGLGSSWTPTSVWRPAPWGRTAGPSRPWPG